MNSYVRLGNRALALSVAFLASNFGQARDQSKPIVDVRFDAPYSQVESSYGDEWAPTWGRDDVLYTGNDDGSSFGGIAVNAIAFGKLAGGDPTQLKGTSINGMTDYREPEQHGPEGARWKSIDSYKLNGVLYRFMPCGVGPEQSQSSCIKSSADDGKSWASGSTRTRALFSNPNFRTLGFIALRPELEALLGEAGEYIYAASYVGVRDGEDTYILGRVRATQFLKANPADWSFQQPDHSWKAALDQAAPAPNSMGVGADGANWKITNSYSVNGALYMFITRCHYPWQSGDAMHRHIFRDSSIIKSSDDGRTWTRPTEDNYQRPMFPGTRFGAPYFVWYGKDGAAEVDNADRYVYAVSNNGHFEAGDDYVLGRVLRTKLPQLSATDWSYYKTGDGMQDGSWTASLEKAAPILSNPQQSSMTGMTYISALDRYVMVLWHYSYVSFQTAILHKDLSTVLEFFEAPKPWGPWTKIKSFNTGQFGWYTPILGQRFQATANSTDVTAILYATGFTSNPEGGLEHGRYKLNFMPLTLSTKPLPHNNPSFVGGR